MQTREYLQMGLQGFRVHKLRSVLTMLGIIFGVAAVIAMLSIGEGAKREALQKYKSLGVNNIIVRDRQLSDQELEEVRARFSAGLSLADAEAIETILPTVQFVSPQAERELEAGFEDKSSRATVVGVTPAFQELIHDQTRMGSFINKDHHIRKSRVCVLGATISQTLFPVETPLGKRVKLGDQWFQVVGVMGQRQLFTETIGELAARDLNQDIYVPLKSLLSRFAPDNPLASQLDQLTIQIKESGVLMQSATVIRRILDRRHYNNPDFDIVIPFELLKQEERERRIYNIVLGSIAAISLLVGGIGIMNIMLATVLERTREIGIRRALGARKREIERQFLIEAVGLSLVGGILGIILGVTMALSINSIAEFKTAITPFSVIVAFGVSGAVGIVFGTFPARRAARIHPIEALRYE